MITIYHRPRSNVRGEQRFFEVLKEAFPNARIILDNFPIKASHLECLINTRQLLSYLEADTFSPKKRHKGFIAILQDFPVQLKVALDPVRISFDFVIEKDGSPYYWEFHEKQHKSLKDDRIKKVFSGNGEPLLVPRGLERLIRDVWRVQYFRPYTIVWQDWFDINRATYKPSLLDGFHEFHNKEEFSFTTFCRSLL